MQKPTDLSEIAGFAEITPDAPHRREPSWRAGEVSAAADPARDAGAAHRGARFRRGARGSRAGDMPDFDAMLARLRPRPAALGAALVGGSRLGRAGRDPQHRHERRAARQARREPRRRRPPTRSICASSRPTRSMSPGSTRTSSKPATSPRREALRGALATYEEETDEPFPQDVRSPARRGAALDGAGLGGHHRRGFCARPRARRPMPASGSWCRRWRWAWAGSTAGSGVIQFVNGTTGQPRDRRPLHVPGPGPRRADRQAGAGRDHVPRRRPARPLDRGDAARGLGRSHALRRSVAPAAARRDADRVHRRERAALHPRRRAGAAHRRAPTCASRWRWPRTGSSPRTRRCCGCRRARCPSSCTARSTRRASAT